MMVEEITNINETHTFRCPRWHKRVFPVFSVVLVCIAIWLYGSLFEVFRDYDDWRAWFGYTLGILVILYTIFSAFKFISVTYTQITIDTKYILMKTPLSTVKIPWSEVLGVHLLHNDEAFRIIGVQRNIIFNTKDYTESDYLRGLIKEKLSPVLNRDIPSTSKNVLLDIVNLVLHNRPCISSSKVYEKVLSVDRKLRYEKVKQLVKSIRNRE
ncbi:MAG: hypothetical protein PHF37_08620 [Phycisphaerae bacterium]|nr:hypothetical protein [Phycisphaerae bacterium]